MLLQPPAAARIIEFNDPYLPKWAGVAVSMMIMALLVANSAACVRGPLLFIWELFDEALPCPCGQAVVNQARPLHGQS